MRLLTPLFVGIAVLGLVGGAAWWTTGTDTAGGRFTDSSSPVLRVGLLPDQSEESLRRVYAPLFDYVAEQAGVRYEFPIPASYGDLVKSFEDGLVDLAYFGGFTFVKAERESNALALVMRDVDREFKSIFLVSAKNPAKSLQDTQNQTFSFGSRLSTSGHLMPRYFLAEQDIEPESFFSSVQFSGAHDKTAYSVQEGKVDVGVLNGEVAARMFKDGQLDPRKVRVLWQTPPYADYVWAVRGDVKPSTRNRLRDAFLTLRHDEPAHRAILDRIGAQAFLPARADNFASVRRVAESLGML